MRETGASAGGACPEPRCPRLWPASSREGTSLGGRGGQSRRRRRAGDGEGRSLQNLDFHPVPTHSREVPVTEQSLWDQRLLLTERGSGAFQR